MSVLMNNYWIVKSMRELPYVPAKKAFISAMVGVGIGFFTFLGGAVSLKVFIEKDNALQRETLKEKTNVVYQLQEEELKNIDSLYENGEISFGEYTVKVGQIQSEKYVKEKAEELMNADEEFHQEKAKIETGENASLGALCSGIAVAVGAPLVGMGIDAKIKKAKKAAQTEIEEKMAEKEGNVEPEEEPKKKEDEAETQEEIERD